MQEGAIYCPIDDCVKLAAIALGETTVQHRYQELLQYAINGLMEFNFDGILRETKVVELTLNDYYGADLPADYVQWTAVGLRCGGKIVPLAFNTALLPPMMTDDCGNPIPNGACCTGRDLMPYLNAGYYFNGWQSYETHWRNGQFTGKVFGAGGGQYGPSFNIDKTRRQIYFSSDVEVDGMPVVMEYVSSGYEPCGESRVHIFARQALADYVTWLATLNDDSRPMGMKQMRERNYYNSLRKAKKRIHDVGLFDLVNVMRHSNHQAPKF